MTRYRGLAIMLVAAIILLSVAVGHLILLGRMPALVQGVMLPALGDDGRWTYETEPPSIPFLQDMPVEDLAELRAGQLELLSSYGWVDEEAGVVRVPVERAMEMMVEEGEEP